MLRVAKFTSILGANGYLDNKSLSREGLLSCHICYNTTFRLFIRLFRQTNVLKNFSNPNSPAFASRIVKYFVQKPAFNTFVAFYKKAN